MTHSSLMEKIADDDWNSIANEMDKTNAVKVAQMNTMLNTMLQQASIIQQSFASSA